MRENSKGFKNGCWVQNAVLDVNTRWLVCRKWSDPEPLGMLRNVLNDKNVLIFAESSFSPPRWWDVGDCTQSAHACEGVDVLQLTCSFTGHTPEPLTDWTGFKKFPNPPLQSCTRRSHPSCTSSSSNKPFPYVYRICPMRQDHMSEGLCHTPSISH